MRPSAVARLAVAGLMALSLGGCITLLPKSKPSQLYRFAVPTPAATGAPSTTGALSVFRATGAFPREAAGDRLLTITGERAAYIADARWVAPAEVLFDEAVSNAFEARPGRVRLVARGGPGRADAALRLDVRNFEVRYGQGRTPVVHIRIRAVLIRSQERSQAVEQIFDAETPADENRVTAIVPAYNQALDKVLGEIVAWTNSSAG
jgi:cholesterol transport system auxiliary component